MLQGVHSNSLNISYAIYVREVDNYMTSNFDQHGDKFTNYYPSPTDRVYVQTVNLRYDEDFKQFGS